MQTPRSDPEFVKIYNKFIRTAQGDLEDAYGSSMPIPREIKLVNDTRMDIDKREFSENLSNVYDCYKRTCKDYSYEQIEYMQTMKVLLEYIENT